MHTRTPGFAADASVAPGQPGRWIALAAPVPSACQALIDECQHSGGDACRAAVECIVTAPEVGTPRLLRR
jgi:hypothetical protein